MTTTTVIQNPPQNMTTAHAPSTTTLTTLVNAAPASSAQSLIEESQVQTIVYPSSSEPLLATSAPNQAVIQQGIETSATPPIGLEQIPTQEGVERSSITDEERNNQKPPYTYTELITQALRDQTALTVSGIYNWIT